MVYDFVLWHGFRILVYGLYLCGLWFMVYACRVYDLWFMVYEFVVDGL